MNGYLARLIDPKLDVLLKTFGAVLLEGPKWIGKTMTCDQRAKSAFYFARRPGEPDPLALARLDSSLVFAGESPRLIDEWQLMPEVWDMRGAGTVSADRLVGSSAEEGCKRYKT